MSIQGCKLITEKKSLKEEEKREGEPPVNS